MCHGAGRSHFSTQRSFSQAIAMWLLGGFAVDQVLCAVCRLIRSVTYRYLRAQAVALFSHHKQQPQRERLPAATVGKVPTCAAIMPLTSHEPCAQHLPKEGINGGT